MNKAFADILRCPIDGQPLQPSEDGAWLVNVQGGRRYPVDNGIAMLLAAEAQSIAQLAAADKREDD